MMMMMMMCKRLAQVPMLCVPIYNIKLAMMQKNSHFYHIFSTYEDGRRQARANRGVCPYNYTSSTAQGGGGSFKNSKPIGEVVCCESRMAERIR